MPARPWAASLDMYRKVPVDLLEGTRRGSLLSYLAMIAMTTLFFMETKAFFSRFMVTDLALDSNPEKRVRVNFNITMMDLKCEYATIDVVSVLGTEQNVTQHVNKFGIDAEGVRSRFRGRNKNQHDIILHDSAVTETIEELHDDGEDAISLDATTLQFAREEAEFLFVDFYASWCSHCRALAPTWETLAEVMEDAAMAKVDQMMEEHEHDYTEEEYNEAVKLAKPVMIAKVDCVTHRELCFDQQIRGYPTLRLFINGKPYQSDYHGHRTVVEFTAWLADVEEEYRRQIGEDGGSTELVVADADAMARDRMDVTETREEQKELPQRPQGNDFRSKEHEEWVEKLKKHRNRQTIEWRDEDHPGCQMSGFLMVDRVPGNFRIQARSKSHDIAAHMTNVSHEVHHLSFGDPNVRRTIEYGLAVVPTDFFASTQPLDGNVYVTHEVHEAHHHYLKVVTTEFENPGYQRTNSDFGRRAYQILFSSQLSLYRNDIVPEAKFSYDLSPIAVSYRMTSRHWYDYVTSLMAIIGGTFTVVGILESTLNVAAKKRR